MDFATKKQVSYQAYLQSFQLSPNLLLDSIFTNCRLLKKLKTKDDEQVELEKREQGFSLYINGANRGITHLPASRRTKTADGQ